MSRDSSRRCASGRRFRGISGDEIGRMIAFLTGSLGDFLDRNYESEKVKTLFLANNVYGKHGGPYSPGTALGLLFHLLSGGEHELQGFYGHVLGGMGAITQAMARGRARVRRRDPAPARPWPASTCATAARAASISRTATDIAARVVVSNADPKRTFLGLVDAAALPEEFRRAIAGIKMDGPCAKVNLVLSEEPRVHGMPPEFTTPQRSLFTLVPVARVRRALLRQSPGAARSRRSSGSTASSRPTSTRRWRPRAATS